MRTKEADRGLARKELRESLTGVSALFADKPFFLSDEMSLVDCPVADPVAPAASGHRAATPANPLLDYMERMFAREAFQASLFHRRARHALGGESR